MPSPLLQLRIPQDLADWLEAKHPSRGEVAEYVRQLLIAEQMKEAAAPLVPTDEISIFERCSKEGHVEGPNGGCRCGYLWPEGTSPAQHDIPSNAEFEAYKAKPKARRKRLADPPKTKVNKSVSDFEERYAAKDVRKVPDQPVSVMNRGGRPMETQEPSSNGSLSPKSRGQRSKGGSSFDGPE